MFTKQDLLVMHKWQIEKLNLYTAKYALSLSVGLKQTFTTGPMYRIQNSNFAR